MPPAAISPQSAYRPTMRWLSTMAHASRFWRGGIGWRLEAGDWRLEAGDWRLEAGDWRLEAGDWRLEARGGRREAGDGRRETRGLASGDREFGSQKAGYEQASCVTPLAS